MTKPKAKRWTFGSIALVAAFRPKTSDARMIIGRLTGRTPEAVRLKDMGLDAARSGKKQKYGNVGNKLEPLIVKLEKKEPKLFEKIVDEILGAAWTGHEV